jgi:hypothetical protein
MTYTVDFFEDAEGVAPVEQFLDELSKKQRAKVLGVINLLEEQGITLPFPYSSQVEGKLRELRTKFGKTRQRVLYFADSKQVFQLLHGLAKDTEKLEASDIKKASDRMEVHELRLKAKEKAKK